MTSTAYDAEAELQKLLAENIHLLPGAQINQDSPRRWLKWPLFQRICSGQRR
jgi:hypothetical protein